MSSDFMRNFLAGWSMGQQRLDQQQQDEMMRRQAEQEAYRRQQDEIENQMRREHWNIQKKQADLEMKKAEFDAKAQAASMMSRDQQVLPPETQDLGGATPTAPSAGVLNLGELIQQRAPIMAEIPGAPEAGPVLLPFREDIQALKEAESQRKMREALGMFQAQEGIKAQFRQPERPVSVAPGGTLIDPATGKVVFKAPEKPPSKKEPGLQGSLGFSKDLRTELKDATAQRDAAKRIIAAGRGASGYDDLALLYNFMKVLDPGSVVRESEFRTGAAVGSVPEQIRAQYASAVSGKKLTPEQRSSLVDSVSNIYSTGVLPQVMSTAERYKSLADEYGIDFTRHFNPKDWEMPQPKQTGASKYKIVEVK